MGPRYYPWSERIWKVLFSYSVILAPWLRDGSTPRLHSHDGDELLDDMGDGIPCYQEVNA